MLNDGASQDGAVRVIERDHLARRRGEAAFAEADMEFLPSLSRFKARHGRHEAPAIAAAHARALRPHIGPYQRVHPSRHTAAHAEQGARPHHKRICRRILAQHMERLVMGDAKAPALAFGITPQPRMGADAGEAGTA